MPKLPPAIMMGEHPVRRVVSFTWDNMTVAANSGTGPHPVCSGAYVRLELELQSGQRVSVHFRDCLVVAEEPR